MTQIKYDDDTYNKGLRQFKSVPRSIFEWGTMLKYESNFSSFNRRRLVADGSLHTKVQLNKWTDIIVVAFLKKIFWGLGPKMGRKQRKLAYKIFSKYVSICEP